MKKLTIDVACDDELRNVVFVEKITNYLEYFFTSELLARKGIAVNANYKTLVQVSINLIESGLYINSLPPFLCQTDNAKVFPVLISMGESIKNAGDLHIQLSFVLYDAMKSFLLENFKKVNKKELEDLRLKIDVDYLNKVGCAVTTDSSIPMPIITPDVLTQNMF